MKAVTIGTTSYREIKSAGDLTANEVVFVGDYVFAADHLTALMVWDAGLNNVRAMTAQEIAALPAQQRAARDADAPDLASARDGAIAAIAANAAWLASVASSTTLAQLGATPTNAQVIALVNAMVPQINALTTQVNRLTQENTGAIKAIGNVARALLR